MNEQTVTVRADDGIGWAVLGKLGALAATSPAINLFLRHLRIGIVLPL
jgi:hypothetical protein